MSLPSNPILAGYLHAISEELGAPELSDDALFERLVSYCVFAKLDPEYLPTEDVIVGGGGDTGLDAVGLLLNGRLITREDDLTDTLVRDRRLRVHFAFVQAKRSPHFSTDGIRAFVEGVRSFFAATPATVANQDVNHYRALKDTLMRESARFYPNPTCELYYATSGTWTEDPNAMAVFSQAISDLRSLNIFSDVKVHALDADRIQQRFQELRRRNIRDVDFPLCTTLPRIEGVRQAYIGIMSSSEYLKLITDGDGNLQRNVFYDNIRDYQGDTEVNLEIAHTMADPRESAKLPILNNGVTIVAREVNPVGTTFTLRDYQIVNGCQTSNVLFAHAKSTTASFMPVKIIETTDVDITNQIIRATNRQTEVKAEAFESLRPFHKRLEEFYRQMVNVEPRFRLFYERRSGQYDADDVPLHNIVSMPFQLKCFVAMFLSQPQSTFRYYSNILNQHRDQVFRDNHSLWPYYVSAVAFKVVDRLAVSGAISRRVNPLRYQMIFLFMCASGDPPPLNSSKKMDAYCRSMLDVLRDTSRATKWFSALSEGLIAELERAHMHERSWDASRSKDFTVRLEAEVRKERWRLQG